METSRGLKLIFRSALFSAVLTGLFWGVWTLAGQAVPSAEAVHLFGGKTFRIEAIASRWWDPLGVALFVASAATVVVFRGCAAGLDSDLRSALGTCAVLGCLVGAGGYGVWTSGLSEASYMPIVFFALSLGFGLVLGIVGIVGVTELKLGQALLGAFLGPLFFGLSSTLIAGAVYGFLHVFVIAGTVALAGAILSAGLCLLICAILKQGFWSGLGRWLIVKKAPAPAVEAPPAPPVEEPPSPERAYCLAVEKEQDALARYQSVQVERQELEARLGEDAPKVLKKFQERL